jgi:hypothetical protein
MVPLRLLLLMFGATEKVIVPLPVSLVAEVMEAQLTVLAALQVQLFPVFTEILPVPPSAAKVLVRELRLYVQLVGAAWLMAKLLPAIVIVPLRLSPVLTPTE